MNISFYGVRGSTPCSCDTNRRYGGNTACVALEMAGSDPIVLDLGTGLRYFGEHQAQFGPLRAQVLVSHLHWDHVQGLPFFIPINRSGAQLDVYGPEHDGVGLAAAFEEFMRPPYFPVRVADLAGDIRLHTVGPDDFVVGDAKVRSRLVPHVGSTLGYRIEMGGISVAYIPDHQQPADGSFDIAPEVLELVDGVDLLIHDSQYTDPEFAMRSNWGHCTTDYAVHVASEGGARKLALFHHDPSHDDDMVDRMLERARDAADRCGVPEVIAAAEGLTLAFGELAPSAR